MSKLSRIKVFSISASVAVLMVGFQNCSKIEMQALDLQDSANLGLSVTDAQEAPPSINTPNGISTEEFPQNSTIVVMQPPATTTEEPAPSDDSPEQASPMPSVPDSSDQEENVADLPPGLEKQPEAELPAPFQPAEQLPAEPNFPVADVPAQQPSEQDPAPANEQPTPAAEVPAAPLVPIAENLPAELPGQVGSSGEVPAAETPAEPTPVAETPAAETPVAQTPVVIIPDQIDQGNDSTPIIPIAESPEDEDCVKWALEKEEEEVKAACFKRNENANQNAQDSKKDNNKNAVQSIVADIVKDNRDDKRPPRSEQKNEAPALAEAAPQADSAPAERCYVKKEEDNDNEDYSKICSLNPNGLALLKKVSNFLAVFKIRGFTIITPETVGSASLEKLEDARGKIIVCGMKIENVNNTRGKLVMVDSEIGSWSNHRGKAILYNTKADTCSDLRGKVVLLGQNSVCNKLESTRGVVSVAKNF